jgi:RHS repeat-associated protein
VSAAIATAVPRRIKAAHRRRRKVVSGRRDYNYFRDYDPSIGRYTQSDPIGLAGGISTYGYVGGNSLAAVDPLGLACMSKNGFTYCAYPNGPVFKVPTQPGWKDFDGSELLYHHYDVQRKIGCADPNKVMQEFINHPTPSKNARPATPGGTKRNDASVPMLPVSNFVTTYLTTDLRNGNQVVVNMTAAGSFFDPGYVARTVNNGIAHTYGEGLSPVQVDKIEGGASVNWSINELVWGRQMQRVIDNCGCNR